MRIAVRRACISLVSICVAGLSVAETIDPASDGSQYAWSENAGWANAEPLGNGGPGVRITDEGVTGWLWLENVGWVSMSCFNTGSCAADDYGVTIDGSGNLAGQAWSENAGWIVFSCETTVSCATVDYGVSVDLVTGELSGHAWAENLGWLVFSCASAGSCGTVDFALKTEVPVADELFSDNLETGDETRWSSSTP